MNDHGNHAGTVDGDLMSSLGNFLKPQEMPSVVRELIRPGGDLDELLMRTRLSRQELVHINRLLYKADRFPWLREPIERLVRRYIASKVSEDGKSRLELVQVATGMAVPSWGQGQGGSGDEHRHSRRGWWRKA